MKRFAALMLTALLLLPSCQKLPQEDESTAVPDVSAVTFISDNAEENLVTIYSGTRYQVVPLVPSGNGCFVQKVYLLDKDGNVAGQGNLEGFRYSLDGKLYVQSFFSEDYHDKRSCIEIYDSDGNPLQTITPPAFSGQELTTMYSIDAEGNYLLITDDYTLEKEFWNVTLLKYDTTGTIVLAEKTIQVGGYIRITPFSSSAPYWFAAVENMDVDEKKIHLFDKELNELTPPITVHSNIDTISVNDAGEVFAQDWQHIYKLDFESNTAKAITPTGTNAFLTADGGVFQVTRDGVFSCDESEEQYLDWTASDLIRDDIDILGGVDGNHLLVKNRCNLNLTEEYAILRRVGDEGMQRRLVTIGTYGSYVNTYLSRAVAVFNQTNEEYYVHLTENTDAEGIAFTDSADFDTISALAARGELPDLQIFAQDFLSMDGDDLYTRLVDHGYLADIASLDGGQAILDSLTGSARRVGLYGGSTYRVPVYMRYQTILSRTAEPLTVETLTGDAASLQAGQTLFPQLHPEFFILETMIPQLFTDRANGTNTMDSAQFLAYLEMLQKVYTSSGGHGYVESGYTGAKPSYSVQYQKLMEEFSDGTVRYIPCTLAAVDGLGAYKLAFPDGQYCGYPDAPAVVSGLCSFGIYKDAKNPEGALAFLRYLLSDTVQNAAIVSEYNFPVTRAAIENELAYDHYVYYATVQNLDNQTDDPQFRANCEEKWTGADPKNGVRGVDRRIVPYTDADRAILQNITENAAVTTPDPTLTAIITEEVDAYIGGARDAAETARVLQSRVEVYLGEKQ